jgi:succinate dehydrogenase/fumarate reductase-like Fe-S protein
MKNDTQTVSQRLMVHTKTAESDVVKISPINTMNQHKVLIKERTHMWLDHLSVTHWENEDRSFHPRKQKQLRSMKVIWLVKLRAIITVL